PRRRIGRGTSFLDFYRRSSSRALVRSISALAPAVGCVCHCRSDTDYRRRSREFDRPDRVRLRHGLLECGFGRIAHRDIQRRRHGSDGGRSSVTLYPIRTPGARMKTADEWLREYAVTHQNPLNRKIHKICVPLIFWSVFVLVWAIKWPASLSGPWLNWANLA